MIAAFKMSMLAAQRQLLGDRFDERHPYPWLVWDVASSDPPRNTPQSLVITARPENEPLVPVQADPVCFELCGNPIRVGRTPENDLVMLDATVSRQHLELRRVGEGYAAVALPGEKDVRVSEASLAPGDSQVLRAGDTLRLGGTRLTYFGPKELADRLA